MVLLYSASHKKGNPCIELIFQKTVTIYQKRYTLLQNSAYPLSFDTSYKMYWLCMNKHGPFQMVMSKVICAEYEFRLNGVCHVSEQKDVLKRHSLAFLLSRLSCFFCLDSLFWHGLASLNLVISTQHHYSAQIVFDMHEFTCSLSFMHWDIIICLVSNERRENALIMKHIVWLNLAWQWRYLTHKSGLPFYWDALYSRPIANLSVVLVTLIGCQNERKHTKYSKLTHRFVWL